MEYLSHVPEVKDTVDKQSLLTHLCTYVVDRFPDSTDLFSEIPAVTRAAKVARRVLLLLNSDFSVLQCRFRILEIKNAKTFW